MKVLFIGGTGNISVSVSKLAVQRGFDLYLLNRGTQGVTIEGANTITADIKQPEQVRAALGDMHFDCVVNWIAFTEADIERDLDLFAGRCDQYIFISSASVYQKPATFHIITESTPAHNPYWTYSQNKIRCEERLMQCLPRNRLPRWSSSGLRIPMIRASLLASATGPVILIPQRMLEGKPVIVHGDGTSLWTLTHSEDFAKGFVGLYWAIRTRWGISSTSHRTSC